MSVAGISLHKPLLTALPPTELHLAAVCVAVSPLCFLGMSWQACRARTCAPAGQTSSRQGHAADRAAAAGLQGTLQLPQLPRPAAVDAHEAVQQDSGRNTCCWGLPGMFVAAALPTVF